MGEVLDLTKFLERALEREAVIIPLGSYALYKTLDTDEPFYTWLERRALEDESNKSL